MLPERRAPDDPPTRWPLSPMQRSMVLDTRTRAVRDVHIEQVACLSHRGLDPEAFRTAWEFLVDRHAVLRASIATCDDGALEWNIAERPDLVWTCEDWTHLADDERDAAWRCKLADDRRRSVSLDHAPLFRVAVIVWQPGVHRWLWTFHHAILDGRAMVWLVDELLAASQSFAAGAKPLLSDRPCYGGFLHWQSGWARDRSRDIGDLWTQELAETKHPSVLADAAAPGVPGAGTVLRCHVATEEHSHRLRAFAAGIGVTPNTLIEAGWALVIARHLDLEHVVFGSIRAGRHCGAAGAAEMIGLVMNVVPQCVSVPEDQSVREWIRSVRERHVSLRGWEHSPADLVYRCSPVRTPTLFDSVVLFERHDIPSEMARRGAAYGATEFQLIERPAVGIVVAVADESRLSVRIAADGERCSSARVDAMLDQLVEVLRSLPDAADRPVGSVGIISREQTISMAAMLTGPTREPEQWPVHALFEDQADASPDSIAVVDGEGRCTYRELEQRANRLAGRLVQAGLRPEQAVAVCAARGRHLVASLLGVLKAGGCYVPIDPDLPDARMAGMLGRLGAPIILADAANAGRPPLAAHAPIRVDRLEQWDEACRPLWSGSPNHLAYGIHTSGSSGEPKLVEVEHHSLTNLLLYARDSVFTAEDLRCVPFIDSIGFDACLQQILVTLAHGGMLVALPDLSAVLRSDHAARFTYIGTTPSVLETLTAAGELPPALRVIGLGAEIIPQALLDRLAELPSLRCVYNFYGPTEAAVYCTVARLWEREQCPCEGTTGRIIGHPIANMRVDLIDSQGRLAPVGRPGEIVVAGEGVARGYRIAPDDDHARFRQDPRDPTGRRRAYLTGDRARLLEDGRLEFLGRLDAQIKLGGIRIEPEEVAAVLRQHPDVLAAAAAVRADPDGRNQLCAYIVPQPDARLDAAVLRGFAAQRLARGMVPRRWIEIGEVPLTPSGKVDYAALATVAGREAFDRRDRCADLVLEQKILAAWQRFFGHSDIGVDDDFYDLGGNSLQAIQAADELESALGCPVPLALFFDAPTVAGLAAALSEAGSAPDQV